jgi:hypothetical protein
VPGGAGDGGQDQSDAASGWLRAAAYPGAIEYEVFHDQLGRPPIGPMLDRAVVECLALTEKA